METPDCGAIEENSTIFVEIKDLECCAFQIWYMLSTQVVACSNNSGSFIMAYERQNIYGMC